MTTTFKPNNQKALQAENVKLLRNMAIVQLQMEQLAKQSEALQAQAAADDVTLDCDMESMKKELKWLNRNLNSSSDLCDEINGFELPNAFVCDGHGELLCYLQEMSQINAKVAQAKVVEQHLCIYLCLCQDSDVRLTELRDSIEMYKINNPGIDPHLVSVCDSVLGCL